MGDQDKEINVLVKYSQQGAEDVAQSDVLMGKAADEFYTKQHQQGDTLGQDFENFQKTVNTGAQTTATGLKKVTEESDNTTKSFHALRMEGMELRQLGTVLTLGGGLLTAGLIADANNYVKTIGAINQGNIQWIGYENQIKNANLEIGESARDALLPALKEGADLMVQIANIVKANPWIAEAALGVGSVMLVLGSVTVIISELVRVVADIGLLLTKAGILGGVQTIQAGTLPTAGGSAGAAGAALGTVTLVATSVILGVGVGLAIANAIEGAINNPEQKKYGQFNVGDAIGSFDQIALGLGRMGDSLIAKAIPSLDEWARKAAQSNAGVAEFIATLTGANFTLSKLKAEWGDTTASGSSATSTVSTDAMNTAKQDFISFQKQIADATTNYESQRADTIQTYEQQEADVTAQYESQRASIISNFEKQQAIEARDFAEQQAQSARDFGEQQAKALRDYNEQVSKSNRDFAESQAKALKQHQLEMAQLEQDHNAKMKDLADSRDALGLVKEQQSYNLQVQQKDQTFALQQQENIQEHKQQLADQKAAYEQSRADAQASYDQQRADALASHNQQVADQQAAEADQLAQLDANHKIEMEKLDTQEKDKLQKMDDAYKKQISTFQTAFVDQLNALDANILGDSAAYIKYLENEAQQFQTWINNFESHAKTQVPATGSSVIGTHQAGGWATFTGPGENELPEYVLDNQSAMMMKSLLGGQMSQANMISAVMAGKNAMAGGGSGSNLTITVNGKGLTMTEIKGAIDQNLDVRLGDLFPAFGGSN